VTKRELSGPTSRTDLQALVNSSSDDLWRRSTGLAKRGSEWPYYVNLGGNIGITIIAMAYPSLVEIFGLDGGSRVLRRFFRLIAGYCIGPAVEEGTIPPGDNPPRLDNMDAEHPVDRQVMMPFLQAITNNRLPRGTSGTAYGLPVIPAQWFKDNWHKSSPLLTARPAIGSAGGYHADTPNDRLMESLGSYTYPDPLLPTDSRLNGPKASIMRLRRPAHPNRIRDLANEAVRTDHQDDVDALLSPIRDVSITAVAPLTLLFFTPCLCPQPILWRPGVNIQTGEDMPTY
jgi:chitinase